MQIKTIKYQQYKTEIPEEGRHILAQQTEDSILVYQAFNPDIANYALENQQFGGNAYSFQRMSWIKPNFLWMMYRCGWAAKPNQEKVLGIWISKQHFDQILEESVFTSFNSSVYPNNDAWKEALKTSEIRLQWDPDHDVYGVNQKRKAIQLGLKGELLKQFGTAWIEEIVDMTPFVLAQKQLIDQKKLDEVEVPKEWVYTPASEELKKHLLIS